MFYMKKERLTIENRMLIEQLLKLNYKLKDIADNYIRNDLLYDFKTLVKNQIKKYPD